MLRLLWRELRKGWIWALVLTGCMTAVSAFGKCGYFIGWQRELFSLWTFVPVYIVMFFQAFAFRDEIKSMAGDFLESRPVPWSFVPAARLVFGLGVIAAACILAAAVFRVTCPLPYVPFATYGNLAVGAWLWFKLLAITLFTMLGSSVSIDLKVRGFLALLPSQIAYFFLFLLMAYVFMGDGVTFLYPFFRRISEHIAEISAGAFAFCVLIVLIVRPRLNFSERVHSIRSFKTAAVHMILAAVLVSISGVVAPVNMSDDYVSFSPEARYAIVGRIDYGSRPAWAAYVVDVEKDVKYPIEIPRDIADSHNKFNWTASGYADMYFGDYVWVVDANSKKAVKVAAGGPGLKDKWWDRVRDFRRDSGGQFSFTDDAGEEHALSIVP